MAAAKIKYNKDGIIVQGNLRVTGTSTLVGALSYVDLALTGDLTVDGDTTLGTAVGDTITVAGTPTFNENVTLDKNLTVGTGATITAGGLTISAGGETVVLGDLVVAAGAISATVGAIEAGTTVTAGTDIVATAGSITAGTDVIATATVTGADLHATDDLTVDDDATISGDLHVVGDIAVDTDLTCLGVFTCGSFAPATVTTGALVCTTLNASGAVTLDANVTLGNGAGDVITVTGQVAGNIEFVGATTHGLIGETGQDLTLTAVAAGNLVVNVNGVANAIVVTNGTGLVDLAGALTIGGITTFEANPIFTLAAPCSITGTAGQDMSILSAGAGNTYLGSAGSAVAVTVLAAGTVQVQTAAQFDAAIQPQTDIDFGGAVAHAITGVAAQNLTIGALTTGILTVESATGNLVLQSDNAAAAITISGAADLVTIGSPLETADTISTSSTIAKTGTANGGAITITVAEGLLNPLTGGNITETLANVIPAGSLVLAVEVRVTEAVVMGGGGTTFDVGVAGATTRYGENILIAAGTTTTLANALAASSPFYYPAATNLVLTGDAGTFTGGTGNGQIRWKIFYISSTAIAS